jgi:hypothetical protein
LHMVGVGCCSDRWKCLKKSFLAKVRVARRLQDVNVFCLVRCWKQAVREELEVFIDMVGGRSVNQCWLSTKATFYSL